MAPPQFLNCVMYFSNQLANPPLFVNKCHIPIIARRPFHREEN